MEVRGCDTTESEEYVDCKIRTSCSQSIYHRVGLNPIDSSPKSAPALGITMLLFSTFVRAIVENKTCTVFMIELFIVLLFFNSNTTPSLPDEEDVKTEETAASNVFSETGVMQDSLSCSGTTENRDTEVSSGLLDTEVLDSVKAGKENPQLAKKVPFLLKLEVFFPLFILHNGVLSSYNG